MRDGRAARARSCGGCAGEPALPARLGRDRGARDRGRAARARAAARCSSGSSATAYPGLSHGLTPLALASKRGWTVTDVDGNVYLDCASASASVPLGAGRAGAARAGDRGAASDSATRTATRSSRSSPPSSASACSPSRPASLSRYDIALNGTEAVEIAIKMMRRATGRPMILGFHGSYHGESTTDRGARRRGGRDLARAARPGPRLRPRPLPASRTGRPLRDPRPGGSGDATVDYIRDHLLFHAARPGRGRRAW